MASFFLDTHKYLNAFWQVRLFECCHEYTEELVVWFARLTASFRPLSASIELSLISALSIFVVAFLFSRQKVQQDLHRSQNTPSRIGFNRPDVCLLSEDFSPAQKRDHHHHQR